MALDLIEPAATYALYEVQREPMLVRGAEDSQGEQPEQYGQQCFDLAFYNTEMSMNLNSKLLLYLLATEDQHHFQVGGITKLQGSKIETFKECFDIIIALRGMNDADDEEFLD